MDFPTGPFGLGDISLTRVKSGIVGSYSLRYVSIVP